MCGGLQGRDADDEDRVSLGQSGMCGGLQGRDADGKDRVTLG